MKKVLSFILTVILCLSFGITAFAEESSFSPQPRLMVSSYKLSTNELTTTESSKLEITFKNYSKTKALSNIKLTVSDESGEINIDGTGTAYVEKIDALASYTIQLSLKADEKAQTGRHKLSISAEYEDSDAGAYSSADTISIKVKGNEAAQSTESGTSQPRVMVTSSKLSAKVLEANKKAKLTMTVKNFSKTKTIYNVKLTVTDESNELGASSVIINSIAATGTKKVELELKAGKNAQTGSHRLTVTADFEDKGGNVFNSSDTISVEVKGNITDEETTSNASQPRVMVTAYSVDGGYIEPSKTTKLDITVKNFSKSKDIKNVKLSINDESGELETADLPSIFIENIGAGKSYMWTLSLRASNTAQIGRHKLTVTGEFEDSANQSYSSTDTISVNVLQTVGIDYSGVQLPVKIFADDTTSLNIAILNTGKSNIRNLKIDTDIKNLEGGGTTFVGEIPAGEQDSALINLRVGKELGDIEGKVIFTYEDEFGKEYKKEAKVSSTIIEKPAETDSDEEEQPKYPLWWAFLIGGIVVGGSVGAAIPIAINNSKKRKEDELRL